MGSLALDQDVLVEVEVGVGVGEYQQEAQRHRHPTEMVKSFNKCTYDVRTCILASAGEHVTRHTVLHVRTYVQAYMVPI